MPDVHAKYCQLLASSSKRWLTCLGSTRLEQGIPDTTSTFAEEGTAARALSELKLKCHSSRNFSKPNER